MPDAPYGRATRWLTCCLMDNNEERDRLIHHLDKDLIESRPVWKPMHLQPLFAGCTYEPHDPDNDVSARLFNDGVCLPSGSSLTASEQARVIESIHSFFG